MSIATATFFGGVVRSSPIDAWLAHQIGYALGQVGFSLRHGGYNGLMEDAARGAAAAGAEVIAVTLAGVEWGAFNDSVTATVHLETMGQRLHHFLDDTDLVVAMGGGVGTLHELSAALWYAGNIREVPVWIAGPTALRLLKFLREDRWLFESPTRPLGFLREVSDFLAFQGELDQLHSRLTDRTATGSQLT